MKKCTYCGKEYGDEASICAIDGEPLAPLIPASLPIGLASDSASGGLHDEVKAVTIRTFYSREIAGLAAANLEAHGIDCWVNADDCGGLYPNLAAAGGTRLLVHASDAEAANAILDPQPPAKYSIEEDDGVVKDDEIVRDRPKLITVVGIWTIYGMGLFMNVLVLMATVSGKIPGPLGLIYFWASVGCGTLCSYMLYRVIKNYIIHKRRSRGRP